MDWLDSIFNSQTMQGLLGYASAPLTGSNPSPTAAGVAAANAAAMDALPTQLGGAPAPTPNPMTPMEANPITGGMMPLPNPPDANNVPGMGTPPMGTAGISPNLNQGFTPSIIGAPLGGYQPLVPGMIDPTTGNRVNMDPLVSSSTNPINMGGGTGAPVPTPDSVGSGPVPTPQPRPPGLGGAGVPLPPVGLGPQSQPQPGLGAPGGPPGGVGMVGGGPGGGPLKIPGPTGPTTPPPVPPGGIPGSGFMANPAGAPHKGFNSDAFLAALGSGLSKVQGPGGLATFARGMGGALDQNTAFTNQERAQKFNQASKALQEWLNATKTGSTNDVNKARADWYRKRTEQLGQPGGGKMPNPYQAAINANNTTERFRQNSLQQLKVRESNARANGTPMTTEQVQAAEKDINDKSTAYRNEILKGYNLTPQQGEQEVGRGTTQPYTAGDAVVPGRIYMNKDGSMTPIPGPNTTSSVLPFHPQNEADMHAVLPGQYYVNPSTNKLMRVPANAKSPGSEKVSSTEEDKETSDDEYQNQDAAAA
jgi:hypothetical protein